MLTQASFLNIGEAPLAGPRFFGGDYCLHTSALLIEHGGVADSRAVGAVQQRPRRVRHRKLQVVDLSK